MEKRWLRNYQNGVPHTINVEQYLSLADLFEKIFSQYSSQIAYANLGSPLSYLDLDTLSRQLASYFQQLGLKKGARIAIMLPNTLQYPIALFAILRAGYVVVNTNPLYTADEIAYQLKDAKAEAIIVLVNFAATLQKALPAIPCLKHIVITSLGDVFPLYKRWAVNAIIKYIKKMVPPYHLPQIIPFNQALKKGKKRNFIPVSLTHEDMAFLQYTGGTTGISKGAILTHGNMIANVLQAAAWVSPLSLGPTDIIVTALPLYHIFSLTANCLLFFILGAKNILITNPKDIPHFIKTIKHSGFTAITGVNTLFNALLNDPKCKNIDFSHLKLALSGGMPLKRNVALKWRDLTHSKILEAYGLTETSPAVSINPLYLEDYNGSIGLPLPSTEVSIRSDDGEALPLGERGELCVKGPQVMRGYWHRKKETAHVFWPDGFLRTGDIATMNKEGFITLVDRKKDMILVSGFNVYPSEVEQVIGMMPGVLEVGVIGVNQGDAGERVKACVVKRDPLLTAEAIIAHARNHLTAYKVPKLIEFYEELPKTNVGKILKRALR